MPTPQLRPDVSFLSRTAVAIACDEKKDSDADLDYSDNDSVRSEMDNLDTLVDQLDLVDDDVLDQESSQRWI